jgi:hypothetical protein
MTDDPRDVVKLSLRQTEYVNSLAIPIGVLWVDVQLIPVGRIIIYRKLGGIQRSPCPTG